ncbi:hypothetical protein Tco_0153084 [Tanacetum coccineum]
MATCSLGGMWWRMKKPCIYSVACLPWHACRGMPAMHKEYMDKVSKLKLMKSVPQYKIMSEISKLELKEYDFMFAIHPVLPFTCDERSRFRTFWLLLSCSTYVVTMPYHVSYKLQNPQAIRIIMGVVGRTTEGRETDDPFQGYAMEIFLPDRLYNIQDAMTDKTESLWKIIIPKKKGEWTQTIGGNLLFFQETQICKPTFWRPT